MTLARIAGSISEWTPYAFKDGKKFIFRRSNGELVASIGIHEDVETQVEDVTFRFDAQAQCFAPVKGNGPRSQIAKPMSELPKRK